MREWKGTGSVSYLVNRAVLIIFDTHLAHALHILNYTLDADFTIFNHHRVGFLDIFFRTLHNWTARKMFLHNVPILLLDSRTPDVTVAHYRADFHYILNNRLWIFIAHSPSRGRNRITAMYYINSILTKWQTLVCLLLLPGHMWNRHGLISCMNGHEIYPTIWY